MWRKAWCVLCLSVALAGPAAVRSGEDPDVVESVPLEDLRLFADVFSRIKQHYVDAVDDRQLLEDAIRGMLDGLDPHSAFLSAREFNELQEDTRGEFGGLGLEVGMKDGFVRVIAPIDDTPAQKAGIKAGDLIIRLDGKPVKGMTLDEAVDMMRGKPGSEIDLTILREELKKPLVIKVKRAVIRTRSVKWRMLDPGYGYVRISSFQEHTVDDLIKAVAKLRREAGGSLQGVVFDLRNNPGGVLDAAVGVSDAFLTSGIIVTASGRTEESMLEYTSQPDDVLDGAPIVVLVDGGSASASEIVAGALQDHRRAVIMGSPTFGKGSVQTIVPIGKEAAIKITTARYYTPSGRSIQAAGILPDIPLASVRIAEKEADADMVKEVQLKGHLMNDDAPSSPAAASDSAGLALEDYALAEALNLLKGLAILKP